MSARLLPRAALAALVAFLSLFFSAGCAPSLLGGAPRARAAEGLARRGAALMAEGAQGAQGPESGPPSSSLALARALYSGDPALAERLQGALRVSDLRGAGVRRGGRPQVGDLLVFRELPDSLDVAVVLEVSGARLRAVGLLRGAPREVLVDLGEPSARRAGGELLNSYIRKARPAPREEGAAECPCLAGELLVDVRALF